MADFDSLISPRVTRIWKELFLLAFIISVGAIAILTFYYSRRPSRETYALSGGSGQLWLTVIAISALGAFLIFAFDEREEKEWRRWQAKAGSNVTIASKPITKPVHEFPANGLPDQRDAPITGDERAPVR